MTSISLDTFPQQNVSCNLVPCKINSNGKCNVSKYFTPYIREEKNYLRCSLRGRPLCGQKIKVPDGYTGVIVKENKKLSLDDGKRNLKMTGSFDEFTYWNWDIIPSSEDKLVKALQWIDVASALHKPVTEYEEDKSSNSGPKKRKFSGTF